MAQIKHIIEATTAYYEIDQTDIYTESRQPRIKRPRQVLMYILHEKYELSLTEVGNIMKKPGSRYGLDHKKVAHAHKRIRQELETNLLLQQEIQQLINLI